MIVPACGSAGQFFGPAADLEQVSIGDRRSSVRSITMAAASSSAPRLRANRHAARRFGSSRRRTASASGSCRGRASGRSRRDSSTAQRSSRSAAASVSPAASRRSRPKVRKRLEHPVAGATREVGLDHGGVDESGQGTRGRFVVELAGRWSSSAASRSAVARSTPSGKIDKLPEQLLLVGGEQVVGPPDRGAERTVPVVPVRTAAAQADPANGRAGPADRARDRVESRPAASSMASGMPSSRRTMSATIRRSDSTGGGPRRTRRARSRNTARTGSRADRRREPG